MTSFSRYLIRAFSLLLLLLANGPIAGNYIVIQDQVIFEEQNSESSSH